jgi:hypothetical protein
MPQATGSPQSTPQPSLKAKLKTAVELQSARYFPVFADYPFVFVVVPNGRFNVSLRKYGDNRAKIEVKYHRMLEDEELPDDMNQWEWDTLYSDDSSGPTTDWVTTPSTTESPVIVRVKYTVWADGQWNSFWWRRDVTGPNELARFSMREWGLDYEGMVPGSLVAVFTR